MTSTTETGHAKNVANLETMITYIDVFGVMYNPSREAIKRPALEALLLKADTSVKLVNSLLPAYSNADAAREVAFEPLNKLITRVESAVKSTETTQQVDENVRTITRKIKGIRATAKLTEEEKKALIEEGESAKENSSSQQSFDNRLDNLDKLIQQLDVIPQYTPNEEELKVETLKALYADLKIKNTAVVAAKAPLKMARIQRDEVLYNPLTGLVDIALDTKTYIKSVFGASSLQFKQVSSLEFKIIKS